MVNNTEGHWEVQKDKEGYTIDTQILKQASKKATSSVSVSAWNMTEKGPGNRFQVGCCETGFLLLYWQQCLKESWKQNDVQLP